MDVNPGDVVLIKPRHPEFPGKTAVVDKVTESGVDATVQPQKVHVGLRWADLHLIIRRSHRAPEAAD